MVKRLIAYLVLLLIPCVAFAQTYRYKRVAIVNDGVKRAVNDDEHYLTFNGNACYESDANGMAVDSKYVSYNKTENGILCYYGNSYWGNAHYYFTTDKQKLNVKAANGTVYAYRRVALSDRSAKARTRSESNRGRSQGNTVINIYNSNSYSSPSSGGRKPDYVTCSSCGGTGRCRSCGGTGRFYSESIYTDGHTIASTCPSCKGTGNCGLCHGSGKLRY